MCINNELLKKKRLEMGLKQVDIAYHLKTSTSVVWAMEEIKEYNPKLCTATKFAKFYNLNLNDIII